LVTVRDGREEPMTGFKTYQRMRDLDQACASLGMVLADGSSYSTLSYRYPSGGSADQFFICVPEDDGTHLPVYSRGIPLFSGDLDACESFIVGWRKHAEYTTALGFKKKIATAESKTADHYKDKRLKQVILEGRDPGYNGVLPESDFDVLEQT